jgi:riboflavin kinase/FMN adenylyltransferase
MPAQLIRSYHHMKPHQQGAVLSIGHFDGVHRGHQALIKKVIEKAKQEDLPSMVMTFEPHAFEFFNAAKVSIPRLTRLREKFNALSDLGVDYVLILAFNQHLASLSARDFVTDIVHGALHPKHILIGDDFHFGRQRQGDFALLQTMGKELGFSVRAMPTIKIAGERVSSSRVRQALAADDLDLAQQLLGHRYYMLGRVRHGDKLGRQWGFPTINMNLHRALTPVHGIYAVYVHGLAAHPLPGVASVGTRPTIGGTQTLLEVHLLDFDQDVYGCYVKIEFCKKLRNEIHFSNVDVLKAHIANDVLVARDYFKNKGE